MSPNARFATEEPDWEALVAPLRSRPPHRHGLLADSATVVGGCSWTPLEGSTHLNYRGLVADLDVTVRIPREWASELELRMLPEAQVLELLAQHKIPAPRCLHAQPDQSFRVLTHVPGEAIPADPDQNMPNHVASDVVDMWERLFTIDPTDAGLPLPSGWPTGRDTQGVWDRLVSLLGSRADRWRRRYAAEFAYAGIPHSPMDALRFPGQSLMPRPLRLIHTDLGRANLLIHEGRTFFIDWELASIGDPVHEIAAHLHKSRYSKDGRQRLLSRAKDVLDNDLIAGLDMDLERWTTYERARSLLVGTVTAARLLRDRTTSRAQRSVIAHAWVRNLDAARSFWPTRELDTAQALDLLG